MEEADRKSALLRLLALALSDGKITKQEEFLLIHIAEQYGIGREELFRIVFEQEAQPLHIPSSMADRLDHIVDLAVMLFMGDSKSVSAVRLFKLLGQYLGFSENALETILRVVQEEIASVKSTEELKKKMKQISTLLQN